MTEQESTHLQDDVATRIRDELVCCNLYERIHDTKELTFAQAWAGPHWHDLCYWGESAARIAEGGCPGKETVPNICRCDCEGCRHNCNAHHGPEVTRGPGVQRTLLTIDSIRNSLPEEHREEFLKDVYSKTPEKLLQALLDWEMRSRCYANPRFMAEAERIRAEREGRVEPPAVLSDDEVRRLMPRLRPAVEETDQ